MILDSRFFVLKLDSGKPRSRKFTIVVGSKVSKKAVQRNLIKRRIKEIVKKHASEIKPEKGVIIIAKSAVLGERYEVLEKDLSSQLRKIK